MPVPNECFMMTRGAKRSWVVTAICATCTAVVLALYGYSFLPLRDYRHYLLPERVLFG